MGATFHLGCFGSAGGRVLRYLPGSIAREPKCSNYFDVADEDGNVDSNDLFRINAENWHVPASSVCMAASLWSQADAATEWTDALERHRKANEHFAKVNETLARLTLNSLDLRHTVASFATNTKCLKLAIFDRNNRLSQCAAKTRNLAGYLKRALQLQLAFIDIVKQLKSRFIVLLPPRNSVDVSSLDIDYPATFAVLVKFYNINFKFTCGETKVWQLWELHKHTDPFAPQACHISYFEDKEASPEDWTCKLLTKVTYPVGVGHFIENDYTLTINSYTLQVYEGSTSAPVVLELENAQMCLIDRLAFCLVSQGCYEYFIRGQRIFVPGSPDFFRVKSLTSESIVLVYKKQEITISFLPRSLACNSGPREAAWKVAMTQLRILAVESWKRQVFQMRRTLPNLLNELLRVFVRVLD